MPIHRSFIHFGPGQPSGNSGGGGLLLLFGIAVALFGVVVILHPELLAYLVGGLFVLLGSSIASWGLALRRWSSKGTDKPYSPPDHVWPK